MLAQFDISLKSFDHPAAHRNHRWNLADAAQHRDKIALFEDEKTQQMLRWAFDYWASGARSRFPALPHQVIHGDAHDENVLIRHDQIVGLVDFGDCCYNPVICELGVCLPYLMMDREDPIAFASDIVEAYHAINPLGTEERSTLLPLICGRLAVTLCVARERRLLAPDHPNWFISSDKARLLLQRLFETPGARSHAFL